MEQYESKQVRIERPASLIYEALSDFSRFTPMLQEKVEGWEATEDSCSFRTQGLMFRLRIAEREAPKLVKIVADETSPIDFSFWLQLHAVAADDTRMRLVLHAKLNMMMKMIIGGKLQQGLDAMAEKIAETFNQKNI